MVCSLWWVAPVPAFPQFVEPHEAPEKSWRMAEHDGSLRLSRHARTFEQAHAGQASELVQFHAGPGTYAHLVHDIPASRVIEELQISLWVKSNRAGLQLAARVVLPRTKDPRTGDPLTTLIRGGSYTQAGTWQKLTIDQPALLVARQTPLLRSQRAIEISDREAYIDMVVLNAYGGTGQTDLWIDDLEVSGQVSTGISTERPPGPDGPARWTAAGEAIVSGAGAGPPPALHGSVLVIQGRPKLVRAIDYNGEAFAWLKSQGFNAVRLLSPPTSTQLHESEASGLHLIAPPPLNQSPSEYGTNVAQILAWDLGESISSELIEPTRRLATRLQSVPEPHRRPTICLPRDDIWQYSRIADLVVLDPPGPHGSLPLADFGHWYLQRVRLMRTGSQFWASVRTQTHPTVMEQARLMGDEASVAWTLEPEQIQLLAYHAIASGARGLWFRSESRLDATDRQTLLRAKTLAWLNAELQMLEAWAATGTHEAELKTGDRSVRASVLQTDRSRLLLVIRSFADQQFVAGTVDHRTVSLEIPGVPATDEAYRLAENGLQRIRQERNAGMHITLEPFTHVSAIVLTQDSLVINFLALELNKTRRLRDELVAEIAAQMYAAVVETHQQLLAATPASRLTSHAWDGESLSQARSELQHFEQLVAGGGHERAYEFLQRGMQQLALARYQHWRAAADSFLSPVASPLCVSFFTLPAHYAFSRQLQNAAWGPNALAGGDLENIQHLQSSGWRNVTGPQPEVTAAVELSLHAPHAGRSALRLQCWSTDPERPPAFIESPPIAITSGPVPVRAEQLVRIHGWARVPDPIEGSMDGLLIYDSLAGTALAERILVAPDWREFTLYRAAPRNGAVTVTMALTGIGEAWLDDLTVNLLELPVRQARAGKGMTNDE
ncbi:MAG: hypothetical protein ACYC6N_10315 [Pirellulaceae bacterium]